MTPDEQAKIVIKYEELALRHLRTVQELMRVTAQLAFCRNRWDQAVQALLGDDPWPPGPINARLRDDRRLRELHEQA